MVGAERKPIDRRWTDHRWVRMLAIPVVAVIALLFLWYWVLVEPRLQAVELDVWRAPDESRVSFVLDGGRSITLVSSGQLGLSSVVKTDQSVYVLARDVDVDASGRTWIEVPIDRVDPSFLALDPERIEAAFDRPNRACAPPSKDAAIALLLFVTPHARGGNGEVCGVGIGAVATAGADFKTVWSRVRPPSVPADADVVHVDRLPDPDAVIARIDRQVGN